MFSYHDAYKNLMDKAIKEIKEKVENEEFFLFCDRL